MAEPLDFGWWDFTSSGYLEELTPLQTYDYTPANRSMVALALIELPAITSHAQGYGILGRRRGSGNNTGTQADDGYGLYHGVNVDGSHLYNLRVQIRPHNVDLANPIVANRKTLVGFRWIYNSSNQCTLTIFSYDSVAGMQSNISTGLANNSDSGPNIGNWVAGRGNGFNNLAGKMYWTGMWFGTYNTDGINPLTDQNIIDLYNQSVRPDDLSPYFYMDFSMPVETKYIPEHTAQYVADSTPTNYYSYWPIHELTVYGTPVKGGTSVQTILCDPWAQRVSAEVTASQYFSIPTTDPNITDFYPIASNFTVAALVRRWESSNGRDMWTTLMRGGVAGWNSANPWWILEIMPGATYRSWEHIQFCSNHSGTTTQFTCDGFLYDNYVNLVTMRYEYYGTGNENHVHILTIPVNANRTLTDNENQIKNKTNMSRIVLPASNQRQILLNPNTTDTQNNKPGGVFWTAMWNHGGSACLTTQNLIDLAHNYKHPYYDFGTDLVFYTDYHQRVTNGQSYYAEVGGYEIIANNTSSYIGNTGITMGDLPTSAIEAYSVFSHKFGINFLDNASLLHKFLLQLDDSESFLHKFYLDTRDTGILGHRCRIVFPTQKRSKLLPISDRKKIYRKF